jgi:type VI secretion system protein ImpE
MTAKELYQAGRLQEAIDAASAEVKAQPSAVGPRAFFCELLCFVGQLERADKQLDTLSQLNPDAAVGVALFRQLLRAATHRQQCFREGRVPDFAAEPSEALKRQLAALVDLRAGDSAAARTRLNEAEATRVNPLGNCDGKPFDDLRDLDDLLAPVLEFLTPRGQYYWIEWTQLVKLEMKPIEHARDILWRPAEIAVTDGPQGVVYLPSLYPGTESSTDDALRLGRATDWLGGPGEPARGVGQRMLMVGDDARPFLEIRQISITPISVLERDA